MSQLRPTMVMLPELELQCLQTGVSAFLMQRMLCYATSRWLQSCFPSMLKHVCFRSGVVQIKLSQEIQDTEMKCLHFYISVSTLIFWHKDYHVVSLKRHSLRQLPLFPKASCFKTQPSSKLTASPDGHNCPMIPSPIWGCL